MPVELCDFFVDLYLLLEIGVEQFVLFGVYNLEQFLVLLVALVQVRPILMLGLIGGRDVLVLDYIVVVLDHILHQINNLTFLFQYDFLLVLAFLEFSEHPFVF